MRMTTSEHNEHCRKAWLKEAARHQRNAAYAAMMARHHRDTGGPHYANWASSARASSLNAMDNLFAAMHIAR